MADVTPAARSGLSSVTRGTLVMMVGTLGFVIESFVARVILIRTLTPDQWGQFFVGLTLVGLLASIGTLGLPSAVARTLPFESQEATRRRALRTAVRVTIPSAVALSGALAVASYPIGTTFGSPLLAETLLFFAAAVGLQIVGTLVAAIFQGFEDVLPNALFLQVLNPSLFIVFLLVIQGVVPLKAAYPAALAAYTISGAVALLTLLLYARRRLPRLLPPGPSDPGLSGALLRFAVPLFLVSVFGYVAGNVDALVLAAFHQPAVAYYSADLSLARLLGIGIGSLSFIILPVTARFVRTGDTNAVQMTYATATKWMILTSLPLFLVFFFFPGRSLAFVYNAGYSGTTGALQILLLGSFFGTLVGPASSTQVSYGQTKYLVVNTFVAALVDWVAAFVLVPSQGIVGAAIAWSAATAVYPILSAVELAYVTGVHPFRRNYVVPLVATAVPVGVLLTVFPFTPPLWVLPLVVLGAAGLFILVVLVSRSIDTGDLLLLEAVEGLLGVRLGWLRRLGAWFLPVRPVPPPG